MTADTLRLDAAFCSCLIRLVADYEIEIVEPCWAHEPAGPAGLRPGDRRRFVRGSPLDVAVRAALDRTEATP